MRFANQEWLWAILAVPVLFVWLKWETRRRKSEFTRFADPSIWKAIAPELSWNLRERKLRAALFALVCLFLALARPQWGSHEEISEVSGMDVVVVLDISNSMLVEDAVPSRLKKSKHWINSLVSRLEGDRVGLVAFAGSSYLACPLTTDLEYVREVIDTLEPEVISNQGTDIGTALETALKAIDRGAEEGQSADQSQASKAIILISDGEDFEERIQGLAKKMRETGVRLYVLGVGTQRGGPVPVRDSTGTLRGFKRDRKGESVVSTFHPDALMKIAQEGSGRYWNMTSEESELDELIGDLSGLQKGGYAERKKIVHEERFQWPLGVALLILFIELLLPSRRTAVFATLLFCFSDLPLARAEVPVGVYLENKKGVEALEKGGIDEATQHFGNAQAKRPDLAELHYNQGLVNAQKSDMESATRSFQEAAKAAELNGDPSAAGRAYYNLGSALTQQGKMNEAVKAYQGAIDSAKRANDAALENETRLKLSGLAAAQEKQKEKGEKKKEKDGESENQDKGEQKEDQASAGKNENDSQGQQDDKKGKDDKDKDGDKENQDSKKQKKQEPRYSQGSKGKKQFQSQKLTREDAERVMAELKERETQLQMKLNRKKGREQGGIEKDW